MLYKLLVVLKRNCCLTLQKRSKWTGKNTEVFANLFDMSINQCNTYKSKHKIPALTKERLENAAALCESLGIPKKEWLKFPILIKELPQTIEQRYLQLKEGGFVGINAEILKHYRKCIHKKISVLKLHGLIPKHINVMESFISYLQPRPEYLEIGDLTDESAFEEVHHSILTRYLMWRFEETQDRIEKFYRVYSLSKIKSFDFLCQNMKFAEEIGIPTKMLLKYGYVLTSYPKNASTVLNQMPEIAGMDMKKAMRGHPKLISVPADNYKQIYNYLKEVNVSDEAIRKCIGIFCMSPTTLKVRMEELKGVPELRVLLDTPNVLHLIISHNQARSRLSFAQQLKIKCASILKLVTTKDTFNMYIRKGEDINNSRDVFTFVKKLLQTENDLIEKNLRKHSYFRNVPLIEIERAYKALKDLNFTKQSLLEVTQILLYPSDKIEEAFEKMKAFKASEGRRLHLTEQLNLMLYFIEKQHHFTGDGIWKFEKDHT